ncbi:hypothetical protein ACVUR7_18430, partial [Escherichia coli]
DRNRSHWSTSKTPSYTKSVSWQHHQVFTNMQSRIAKGILVGESKITPWAIPSGSIYPPMKNIMEPTK